MSELFKDGPESLRLAARYGRNSCIYSLEWAKRLERDAGDALDVYREEIAAEKLSLIVGYGELQARSREAVAVLQLAISRMVEGSHEWWLAQPMREAIALLSGREGAE